MAIYGLVILRNCGVYSHLKTKSKGIFSVIYFSFVVHILIQVSFFAEFFIFILVIYNAF